MTTGDMWALWTKAAFVIRCSQGVIKGNERKNEDYTVVAQYDKQQAVFYIYKN